jgi:uncharacterized protein with HEPN domain
MANRDRWTLEQMLETAQRIRAVVQPHTHDSFEADEVTHLALLHLIQRLGEAASRLTSDFRAAHEEFPWAEMIGMRNRIVHSYDDLDAEVVWRVATDDIEPVVAALERVLAD